MNQTLANVTLYEVNQMWPNMNATRLTFNLVYSSGRCVHVLATSACLYKVNKIRRVYTDFGLLLSQFSR